MSKLYKLKEWFSLEETAKRLSSSLGEPVSLQDLLQLIVEGHVRLSWRARHVAAERVAKACCLHYASPMLLRNEQGRREFYGPVSWHGEVAFRAHTGMKEGEAVTAYATLEWTSISECEDVERLDGLYWLELNECGALKDWVHSLLTQTGGELITVLGFFVSDQDGVVWRIMEYSRGVEYEAPDGTIRRIKPSYHPSGSFPDPRELVIQRRDIETFEAQILSASSVENAEITSRERETLLNITGGLLSLLLGKSPSGIPHSLFKSQTAIIDALLAHHEGKPGMSKRTLEEKFKLARRNLLSS